MNCLKIPKDSGDIIECGVFKGTGHLFWLKLLDILIIIQLKSLDLILLVVSQKVFCNLKKKRLKNL